MTETVAGEGNQCAWPPHVATLAISVPPVSGGMR
jgi:hypothetical protein